MGFLSNFIIGMPLPFGAFVFTPSSSCLFFFFYAKRYHVKNYYTNPLRILWLWKYYVTSRAPSMQLVLSPTHSYRFYAYTLKKKVIKKKKKMEEENLGEAMCIGPAIWTNLGIPSPNPPSLSLPRLGPSSPNQ